MVWNNLISFFSPYFFSRWNFLYFTYILFVLYANFMPSTTIWVLKIMKWKEKNKRIKFIVIFYWNDTKCSGKKTENFTVKYSLFWFSQINFQEYTELNVNSVRERKPEQDKMIIMYFNNWIKSWRKWAETEV